MQKKEEFESARLMDFEFRQRARATRLLARSLGLSEEALVRDIALKSEDGLLDAIAAETSQPKEVVAKLYGICLSDARKQLIAERGDPSPYRLG
ncbi:hypothetical protein [Tsuneonella sp. HG222]